MTVPAALSAAAEQLLQRELLRRSLGLFYARGFAMLHGGEQLVPGPHTEAMVHVLEQLALGTIKRLVITLPPRHGKSELVSASFPAWLLGNDPGTKITVVSYGEHLSTPLVEKSRQIVKHPDYLRIFPDTRIKKGHDRADHYAVTGGGEVRGTSKTGAITGLGTHFMIVDDYHKAGDSLSLAEREKSIQLFQSTFFTRFDNLADGRIVIVQQRVHEDDLPGWALRHGKWHHLNLPAIAEQDEQIPLSQGRVWQRRRGEVLAPKLASAEFLAEQKLMMGPRNFGAQYQQNPVVADGGLFELEWFGQYEERPERRFFQKVVQSWDTAATDRIGADYSVGMTWGYRDENEEWYLLDLIRVQLKYTELLERVLAWHRRWRTDALVIEDSSVGTALLDQVRHARLPGMLVGPKPTTSKLDRVAGITGILATGKFLLPASAPWLPALRSELQAFPDGRNDDQVDALTQFVDFVFDRAHWVQQQYSETGRPLRPIRPSRTRAYYDGNAPSQRFLRN